MPAPPYDTDTWGLDGYDPQDDIDAARKAESLLLRDARMKEAGEVASVRREHRQRLRSGTVEEVAELISELRAGEEPRGCACRVDTVCLIGKFLAKPNGIIEIDDLVILLNCRHIEAIEEWTGDYPGDPSGAHIFSLLKGE